MAYNAIASSIRPLDKIIAEAAAEIENNNPNPQLIIF